MSKCIFFTGVVSSVGKGIAGTSIGTVLQSRKPSVSIPELGSYLSTDDGTTSPYHYNKVSVSKDRAETEHNLVFIEWLVDANLAADPTVNDAATRVKKEGISDNL